MQYDLFLIFKKILFSKEKRGQNVFPPGTLNWQNLCPVGTEGISANYTPGKELWPILHYVYLVAYSRHMHLVIFTVLALQSKRITDRRMDTLCHYLIEFCTRK